MEPKELSPALLRAQVTVVATLSELLATLPRRDEVNLLVSPECLYSDLEKFTVELQDTLYRTDNTWYCRSVTCDDGDPLTSLSRALAAYKSTPWTRRNHVTMAASKWLGLVSELLERWAWLARKATELHDTCREVATKAAEMVRQRLEAALGLLERLVAACDEATAFPRELQRLLRDTEAALEGTNEGYPNIPEDLVAKVAVAEWLWEATSCLVKDHLRGTLQEIINFLSTGGPASPSASVVAEQWQRAIKDILIRPPEHPQGVPKVSPVSMELQKLSLALLQPQVTMVATLGELLAILPRRDEEKLLVSPTRLYSDLEEFTEELQDTLYTDGTWWHRNITWGDDDPVTSDDHDSFTSDDDDSPTYYDEDPPTSLSQALAAYKSTPWTRRNHVTMAARKWQESLRLLVFSWDELARKATELHNTCRVMATKAADMVASITARARELQDEAARYGTAQENMMELDQAPAGEEGAEVVARDEAQVRRDAKVAASEATRATMVGQQLEAALGLLERLVAACDEATAFPRELQRRVGDIKAALKRTNEASPDVPEALVTKVAVAERLWEANARLGKDHLLGALNDITRFYFSGGPTDTSACEVAERCQRANNAIPRLFRPLDRPQGVHNMSPVTMELQELSPALLQPQVTVVAILQELLGSLPWLDDSLPVSLECLCWDLEAFSRDLRVTLHNADDTLWRNIVTSDDDDPLTSLSQALAASSSTTGTPRNRVIVVASEWQVLVAVLVDSWAELAKKATKLCNTWREMATEAATKVATATTRARELQDEVAYYWTVQENMVELGQALGREEGARVVARPEAQVRREARVAAREARRATMERQQVEEALGLLERLVAACDEATAFPRELQRRVGDIEAALKATNPASPDVPEDLVVKLAEAEWLWEANARLVKGHLVGILNDITSLYFGYGPDSPCCHWVAKRCHRAIRDIPRLVQAVEHPQSIPKASPVTMEPQKLSSALLQPQVTLVATLGELLATLPSLHEEVLLMSPGCLYWDLEEFTRELQFSLDRIDDTWRRRNVTSDDDGPVTSLSQALAAYKSTRETTWHDVTMVARGWQGSVNALRSSWAQLASTATELYNTCREVATKAADMVAFYTARARELQAEAARDGTAQENMMELDQAPAGEEEAEVVVKYEDWVRREAREAASEATRATMVRQQAEVVLGLLERLVAACVEATAFPRELQRLLGDIEADLKATNEASPDVPEDLVAKVAKAERLWEANAQLAKDHLVGTLGDITKFLFTAGPASLSACEVAERCQRAVGDIPRLLRPPEDPQSVPKMSPVSMELQELSPALLQPQVTVVATLGEMLDTLPSEDELNLLLASPENFYWDLKFFIWELRDTRDCFDDIWRRRSVAFNADDPPTSLSQALAAYRSTPGTDRNRVTMAASKWQELVDALVNRWAWLARKATELRNTCRDLATKMADMEVTAWARELQDEVAPYVRVMENMMELGQALGREEGAEVVARQEAWIREEARVAASKPTTATMMRQRVEAALGLLERLVTACDEATVFPRELQRLMRAIKAALKGTNEASPNVPEDLVAKVANAERLWEANAHLVKDHLWEIVDDIIKFYINDGPNSPSACEVAERCRRATEDISRLVQHPERPQSVHSVSPLSLALLQPQIAVVATLGKLVGTTARQDVLLPMCKPSLHKALENFTKNLRVTLRNTDNTWWHPNVTSGHNGTLPLLSQALAAYESTTWDQVKSVASEWQKPVAKCDDSWSQWTREATELRNACRDVATGRGMAVAMEEVLKMGIKEAMGEAMVAKQQVTRMRQRANDALELLNRLVIACTKISKFYKKLQIKAGEITDTMSGREEPPHDFRTALAAKVAEIERLCEASNFLARDYLVGALGDICTIFRDGDPVGSIALAVAEQCQRAYKDIRNLLQGQ